MAACLCSRWGACVPTCSLGADPSQGTGFLDPEPVQDERRARLVEAYQRLLQASAPRAFASMRKVFCYRAKGRSSFYQTFSMLFTNEFLRAPGAAAAGKYVMFAACTQADGGKPAIGVEFADFCSSSSSVSLWHEPPIDAVESACIRSSMRDLYPMPALAEPSEADDEGRRQRPVVERLERRPTQRDAPVVEVDYYLSSGVVDSERIAAIAAALDRSPIADFAVGGVDVQRERATQRDGGWRIVFRMNAAADPAAVDAARKRMRIPDDAKADGFDPDETY